METTVHIDNVLGKRTLNCSGKVAPTTADQVGAIAHAFMLGRVPIGCDRLEASFACKLNEVADERATHCKERIRRRVAAVPV